MEIRQRKIMGFNIFLLITIIFSNCAAQKIKTNGVVLNDGTYEKNITIFKASNKKALDTIHCLSSMDLIFIRDQLKKKKIPSDKLVIYQKIIGVKNNCVGLYIIHPPSWKKYKNINFNGVNIPFLKAQELIMINSEFEREVNNKLAENEFLKFQNKYDNEFAQEQLQQIKKVYLTGMSLIPKGYFR